MDLHCYLVWALNRIKFDEFLDWPFFSENIQSRQQFIFGTKKKSATYARQEGSLSECE